MRASARTVLRSVAEGAALALAGCAAAGFFLDGEPRRRAWIGLGVAWAVSSASVAALLVGREVSPKAFWKAYGGGLALRAGALAVLMAAAWKEPPALQAAGLGSYALGVLGFLLLEYRHLMGVKA